MVRRECGACGYGLGLACLVLGNRLAGRSGQHGLQICCGGFGQLVDARLADRVEEAAVFADVTDRLGPPRLVGQVLQDLVGSGPWGGISVPSTPGTTSMAQVGAKTGRDRAGLRFPGAVPGPRRPDDLLDAHPAEHIKDLVAHADRVLQVAGLHSGPAGSWAGSGAGRRTARQGGHRFRASAPSTPLLLTARYRPVRHPGSAGVRRLSFSEPPDSTANDARHFRIERIPEGITRSR